MIVRALAPSLSLPGAALVVSPLLIPVVFAFRQRARAYQWLCVVVIPYIGGALVEVVANPERRTAAAILAVACFALFIVAVIGARTAPSRQPPT